MVARYSLIVPSSTFPFFAIPSRPDMPRRVSAARPRAWSTAGMGGRDVDEVEGELISDTSHHGLGNRTHAATILGISIRTLRNKLKQYGESGFTVPTPGEAERPTA